MENEVNLLETANPKTIQLADGKEYKLPPIDMTTLANMEKTLGFGLGKLATKLENETVTTMRSILYALLKEEQPEITVEQVGRLVTLKEMKLISQTITEIMIISG